MARAASVRDPIKRRGSKQILGVRSQLVGALNANQDGAYVTIDIKTAMNLVEICNQAYQFELAQETTELELIKWCPWRGDI